MHPNNFPMGMMPFPFMVHGNHPNDGNNYAGEPPVRITTALIFLQQLTSKTQPRAVANDISIEVIPGQKLATHEEMAQREACEMLTNYFMGKLKPDVWEEQEFMDHSMDAKNNGSMACACPLCGVMGNAAMPMCPMCKGTGEIIVHPR